MRRIRIPNIRLIDSERTFLDADYTSGIVLTVTSNLGFATNNFVIAGEIGEEKTETQLVVSVTQNTGINLLNDFKFAHNKSTSIYRSEWNQISLERKAHTSDTWLPLVTTDLQWDSRETVYIDQTGNDSYDYRFRFYNSQTLYYSEYSPTVSGAGFTPTQVGMMLLHVRQKIKDPNRVRFTDTEIIAQLQAGQRYIQTLIPELWFLRVDTFEEGNGIPALAAIHKYALSVYPDLYSLGKIKYEFISGNTLLWDLEFKNDIEFDRFAYNQLRLSDDNIIRYKLLPPDTASAQGYISVDPVPKTTGIGTFYPIYYRNMAVLDSVNDTTDLSFPEILEDFASWKLHKLMGNEGEASTYESLFFGEPSVIHAGRLNYATKNLVGIELLKLENDNRNRSLEYPRSLWNWKGRKARTNYYRRGLVNRDYVKENFFNGYDS